ncbi:MAG: hypothetical protein ACRCYO_07845 [Bacteroidia bacterium]
MKTTLLLFFMLPIAVFSQNRYSISFRGQNYIPVKTEMPKMSPALGFNFSIAYQLVKKVPLSLQFNIGHANYDKQELKQLYAITATNKQVVTVFYTSAIGFMNFGLRYDLTNKNGRIHGYVMPLFGRMGVYSNVVIGNARDVEKHSEYAGPFDDRYNMRNNIATYGGELGLHYDLSPKQTDEKLYFSLGFGILQSFSSVKYVNSKYMKTSASGYLPEEGAYLLNDEGQMAQFINLSNREIQETKIAEVHQSNLRMIGINWGLILKF